MRDWLLTGVDAGEECLVRPGMSPGETMLARVGGTSWGWLETEVVEGDEFVAVGARAAQAETTGPPMAVGAALLAEQTDCASGALVDGAGAPA